MSQHDLEDEREISDLYRLGLMRNRSGGSGNIFYIVIHDETCAFEKRKEQWPPKLPTLFSFETWLDLLYT